MPAQPLFIAKGTEELYLLPKMTNRHGLVAGANFSRYANEDMGALIAKAASTAHGKARNQTYCQIATQVANDLPRALLYETLEVTAYHTNLQNLQASPGPRDFTFGVADWTLKK